MTHHRLPDPAVARLAGRLSFRIEEMTGRLVDRIDSEIELYRVGAVVSRAELTRSVRQNLSSAFCQFARSEPADLSAPRETGRVRADIGAPLPEVLRAYRIGFAFFWESLLSEARREGKKSLDSLLDTATDVWALADGYSMALTDAYRTAVAQQIVAADRRRSALVAALLRGAAGDGSTAWEVALLLGLPYRGNFLLVVAETAALGAGGMSGIEDGLNAAGVASAWRVQPDFEIGVLSYARRRSAAEVLQLLRAHAETRVGVSPEYHELEHTPRAKRYARVALESLPQGQPEVRQLEDNPLVELAMGSPETTRRVAQRVLGRVLTLPIEERTTLLATAAAWLDARGSAREAGRVLFCHENTVRYRIHRLEEHLDRRLDDPTAIAELATALAAVRMFPSVARLDEKSEPFH